MPTKSPPRVLVGSQTPRVRSVPTSRTSAGDDAVELCDVAGVRLDEWQANVLRDSLGEQPNGRWSSFETCLTVPRQNGKGEVLLARELAGLFLFGERLLIHTAHEFKTAAEAFLRIKTVIENCDDLRRKCKKPREANGEQGIELLNGNRLRFLARSKGSGRGFSGDLVILDEAYELPVAAMGALLPTMSARPNPQLWYTSSAGQPDSEVLRALRVRGLAGTDPQLCYLEWSAPDEAKDDDRQAWAAANPALGIRISEEYIARELAALAADLRQFRRERLGIWEDETALAVISAQMWAGLADPKAGFAEPCRPAFAIDVTPDRGFAAVAAAGPLSSGGDEAQGILVDLVDHRAGTDWIVGRVLELRDRHNPCAIVLDKRSPAGSLLPDFAAAGVEITVTETADALAAVGAFYDACVEGTLHHLSQPGLSGAVAGARKRDLAEGAWLWDRKRSADICPLVAATYARWAWTVHGQAPPRTFWGAIG